MTTITGTPGNDTIFADHDFADGGAGNDSMVAASGGGLSGGSGNDTLVPDGSPVGLIGGSGKDSFVIKSIAAGSSFSITDLELSETIDVSATQGLHFIGAQILTGVAGQFNYVWAGSDTRLMFDLDGDGFFDEYAYVSGRHSFAETAQGSNILRSVPDLNPPSLVWTLPTDNNVGVEANGSIYLGFSEEVRAGTGTIELHTADGALFRSVNVRDSLSFVGLGEVRFSFGPLNLNTSYYVTIPYGAIEDLAGNPYAGIAAPNSINFTTAAEPRDYSRTFGGTIAFNTNYAPDQDIVLIVNGADWLKPNAGGSFILYQNSLGLYETILITDESRVTISGNTIIINPTSDIQYGYGLNIASYFQAPLQTTGGAQAGFWNGQIYSVQTVDPNAPRPHLINTSPADDTANVSANASIGLTFDRPITFGAGQFEFRRADGALVQAIGVADASQVTYSGNSVTVHPTIPLATGVNYSVLLRSGVIRDYDGNSFAGITSAGAFNFTVPGSADMTAPTLVSSTPAAGATNVSLGTDFTLNFSETVQRGLGNIEIHKLDGYLIQSISIGDLFQVKVSGSTITIDPRIDLSTASDYYLILPSGAVLDYAGNSFAGITSPAGLSFHTSHPGDGAAPTLRSTTPSDNQTGVAPQADIILSFDERVKAGFGSISIHRASDGATLAEIEASDTRQVTVDESTVTINAAADLDFSTDYYLTLSSGFVVDLSGNPYEGLSSPTLLNFSTAAPPDLTPPLLVSTTPQDNASGVNPFETLVLTFNEAVKITSGNVVFHKSIDDSIAQSIPIHIDSQYPLYGNTISISPGNVLSPGTAYYVTIAPGVITDLAGNEFLGIGGKFDLNYSTLPAADIKPPVLTSSSPLSHAARIPTDANIVLTFSELIKAGSGDIVLHNASDDAVTAISIGDASQVHFFGNSVTIDPTADLSPGTLYYVTAAPGVILDPSNNAFAGILTPDALNFTTTDGSETGLVFNILYDPSASNLPFGFAETLETATKFFSDRYTDSVTINLHVGYGEVKGLPLGPHTLAATVPGSQPFTYAQIREALTQDARSSDDLIAYGNLPLTNPLNGSQFYVADPEAAALQLPGASTTVDAYIGFSNDAPFDYDNSNGVTVGQYDFFATAAHEIAHAMGRVLGEGEDGAFTPFDLFRFAESGKHPALGAPGGYFSIQNGREPLKSFNIDAGGTSSDWAEFGGIDAFNAFGHPGAVEIIGFADFIVMDVLGYDEAPDRDTTAPVLLSSTPSDDQFEVNNPQVTLIFNEAVTAATGDVLIRKVSDGATITDIPITDATRISFTNSVVTIDPGISLGGRSGYYVTLSAGAITDLAGNPFTGLASTTALNFTTADGVLPVLSIVSASADMSEGNAGTKPFTFTVSRTGAIDVSSTVHWAVDFNAGQANAADFSGATSGDLFFSAGDATSKLITINTKGDTAFEADETLSVSLSSVSGATISTAHGAATGIIRNDDLPPVLSVAALSADKAEGNSGTTPFTFKVVRTGDVNVDSTVHWSLAVGGGFPASDASDFSGLTSGDLIFSSGDIGSRTITLNVVGDRNYDSNGLPEHFSVALSSPTGATLDGSHSIAFGSIQNDDARPVTDFNGDGKSDFLWQQDNFQPAAWLMNGSTITSGGTINFIDSSPANPGPGWHIKGSGDFNSDGNADIIWQEDNGKPAIWLVNGFQLSSGGYIVYTDLTVTDPGTNWHIMGSGDFNSDGNADLLWQDDNGMPAIWLINGFQLSSGGYIVYTNLTPASPGPTWHIKGAADFNGDGNADVLWQDDLGNPAIWLVNGFVLSSGGYIVNPNLSPANLGAGWHIKGAGDFDGDGKADVVWQHDDGRAAIWLIDGFALRSSTIMATNPGPTWNVTGAGDYNGDGKADIQWQNDNGQPMVWLMDGVNVLEAVNAGANPGATWHLDWV